MPDFHESNHIVPDAAHAAPVQPRLFRADQHLSRRLRDHFGQDAALPSYRTLKTLMQSGEIPAEPIRDRWFFREADVPQIVSAVRARCPARKADPRT